MFPSVAPTVALYSRMTQGAVAGSRRSLFTAGYLADVGRRRGAGLRRSRVGGGRVRGRRARVGPRGPLGRRGDAPRRGRLRADAAQGRLPRQVPQPARLPARLLARRAGRARCGWARRHGAWCVGCCWALMASLFALGVMSIVWMAFVAGLIAVEKTVPWRRGRDLRDGGDPARARRAPARRARRDPGPHDPRKQLHAADGVDGLAAEPRPADVRFPRADVLVRLQERADLGEQRQPLVVGEVADPAHRREEGDERIAVELLPVR